MGQVQSLEDEQLQAYMQDDQPMLTAVQAAATTYQVGKKKYIYRTNGHDTYGKTYVCIGVGEHCYVWMDETLKADYDTAGKTSLIAADMAAVYDGQPYRILNQLCAGNFPAKDGSGKLSILLESLSSASGMYMYDEGITAIHINTPSASSYVSGEMSKRNGLLVHEGQHAILWLKTGFMSTGRYSWLNEGLAVAVMDYLWGGTDSSGWLNGIGSNTVIRSGASLIYENYRDDNAQDYGMPYLFVRYVIDRMAGSYQPMKVLPKFYTIDASSLSCEQYLEKVTGVSFKDLMADFYTAVAAGESSSSMSHPAFGGIVGENEVAGTISGCSSGVNISISLTATDSYVGGIAGVNIGTIEKCVAGGNLSVTQANGNSYQVYLGGIAGRIEQFGNMGGYVKQCAFTGTLRVTGGTAVTGQICAQVNANVLNSAIGLNGHVSDCYGKNGQGAMNGKMRKKSPGTDTVTR